MAFNAGEIVIELKAQDGGFTASVKNAGALLRQFKVDAEQTAKSVKRLEEHQFSLGTQFRNIVLTLGNLRFAMMDINDVFLRLPAAILKSAGALEQTQAMLAGLSTQLTKTAREAEGSANFDFITRMAQRAPFEIAALSNSFVKLKSAGIDPTAGSMQTLIDSVARFGGDSQTLQRASVAIQQMAGKGVISMEELRQQLGEAVPTAMRDMALGMSMSMAELTAAVSKGTVESTSALNKMFVIMSLRNRGAALELMDTWNGALAQLKTRWELAAKEIYDAGFGKAMRDIVTEVSTGLQSNDFRRFSLDVGQSLGSAVRTVSELAKSLYEMADVLKFVGLAWLSYKFATNFVVPSFEAMSRGASKLAKEYAISAQQSKAASAIAVASAASDARATMAAADSAVAASRYKIQQIEAEILAHRRLGAELAVQRANAIAANSSSFGRRTGIADPNTGQMVAPSTRLAAIAAESQANERAMQALQRELSSATVAHQVAATAAAGHASKVAAIENGALAAGRGMTALAAAGRAASTAFYALGGWATVLNVAIAAGAYFWATWESAADKAAKAGERALRAQKGLSNKEDLDRANTDLKEATDKLGQTQNAYNFALSNGWDKGTVAQQNEFKKLEAALRNGSARVSSLKTEVAAAEKAITERTSQDVAGVVIRASDRVADAVTAGSKAEMVALERAADERLKAAGNNPKLQKEIAKKLGDDLKAVVLKDAQQQLALLEASSKATKEQADKGVITASQAAIAIKEFDSKIVTAREAVRNAKRAMEDPVLLRPDPKPGVGAALVDPLEALLERLRAKNSEISTELNITEEALSGAERAAAVRARLDQEFIDGKYDSRKGKNVIPADSDRIAEAKRLATDGIMMQEAIKDRESFTRLMADLNPRYVEAVERLADPLSNKAGSEQTKTEKFLNSLGPERMAALAKSAGTTVEAIKEALGKSMVVDASGDFAKMATEAASIERGITVMTEAENKKRKLADLDVFRQRQQNRIDDLLLESGYTNEIAVMQGNLDKLISARTKEINQKPLTAMEQLQKDWADTTKAMDQATAGWANSTVDAFVESARTGKLQWKGLVESILADMLKLQIKKAIGGSITSLFSSMGSWFGNIFGFANGGIMTSSGAMPLRAYASGGIAKSPQVAIYGEGSMNEAYVPLPDGRTIPVTMSGGGQMPNVTVNVINQSGTQVNAKQSRPRMDGKQMILDVVLEGMSTPGPFRDSMKSMRGS